MSFQEFEPIFHNLNEEFNNLKGKINILMNKFSDLEKQLKSNSKAKFRCSKCNKYFESMDNFQKHKEKNEICDANLYPYQCENVSFYLQVRNIKKSMGILLVEIVRKFSLLKVS